MPSEPNEPPIDSPDEVLSEGERQRRETMRRLVEADQYEHDAPLGRNGGVACDVRRGPCACGAWHFG